MTSFLEDVRKTICGAPRERAWGSSWKACLTKPLSRQESTFERLGRYGLAAGTVGAGFGFWLAMTAWLGWELQPFCIFYPAVMVAALLGGLGPGLLATALSDLLVSCRTMPPVGQSPVNTPVDRLSLVLFAGMGLGLSVLAELYRRRRDKAAAQDRQVALMESEERYHTLFRTMNEGFVLCELIYDEAGRPCDYRYIEVNPAFELQARQKAEEVIGKRGRELFPRMEISWVEECAKVVLSGQPVHIKNYVRATGRHYQLSVFGTGGSRFAILFTDVTESKKAEEVLARSKDDLEHLVAERTAKLQELVGELEHFSYSITHDMRAPLRAMQGFAAMIGEACASCQQREPMEFLRRIKTSAGRMDALITDALNYSRAVRQELALEPVDAEALLRGMLDSYPELQCSKADIRIVEKIPLVMANVAGLTQCFSNLLGNAVKFVKPGQKPVIRIRGERHDGWVRIWVNDEGIGIPEPMRARVFDMFSRGHQNYEGTGIGLALVRKVVERMGGKAGVESVEGKESRFWLDLQPGDRRAGR